MDIGGQPSGRVRECGTKHVNAAEVVGPNSNCELLLKLPGEEIWKHKFCYCNKTMTSDSTMLYRYLKFMRLALLNI